MNATETQKHYDLPWSIDEFTRDGETWGYIVSGGTVVCEIAGILDSCGNRENAEFIVRAVNCHGDMLEALRSIAEGLPAERATHRFSKARELAREALAKAEGRS